MTIDFKSIFYIANPVCAFQRTLRLAMSSENRLPRQQRPAVMFGQNIRQFLALVEAAVQPPFFAQRHGQHKIEMLRFQPVGRMAAHQLRQRTAHAEVGQMLQRAYHTADGRLIIQRSPHPLKCRRLLLTASAHRPALYSAETQGATVCRVRKKLFQVRRATAAKTAIRPGFARGNQGVA